MLRVPTEQVYKTIVITRESNGRPVLALVPGPKEVDLKLLAKALGEKKVHLPTEREAEQITHLQAGGISPLALIKRGFQVMIDFSAQTHDQIYISGGQRGLDIRISPHDLQILAQAQFANISKSTS
jgi:Cys-tRNA(Pro)/Cys-tRNA(Cys) deacylase